MGAPDDIIYIFSFSFFFSSPCLSCPKYIYLGQKLKSVTQWYRHWLNLNNIKKKKPISRSNSTSCSSAGERWDRKQPPFPWLCLRLGGSEPRGPNSALLRGSSWGSSVTPMSVTMTVWAGMRNPLGPAADARGKTGGFVSLQGWCHWENGQETDGDFRKIGVGRTRPF